jgi:(p)ppGpp synthase/HD superfamily hydrolase
MNTNLIMRAALFAEFAHRGQARRFTASPYIEHPRRVASYAARLGLSDEAIAAAFLHDVVEDCDVKLPELADSFGSKVAAYVDMLSDLQDPEKDGNRAERKKRYFDRLQTYLDEHYKLPGNPIKPDEVITVKTLDIIDNARSLAGEDPDFWRTVRSEMKDFYAQFCEYMHPKAAKALKKYVKE